MSERRGDVILAMCVCAVALIAMFGWYYNRAMKAAEEEREAKRLLDGKRRWQYEQLVVFSYSICSYIRKHSELLCSDESQSWRQKIVTYSPIRGLPEAYFDLHFGQPGVGASSVFLAYGHDANSKSLAEKVNEGPLQENPLPLFVVFKQFSEPWNSDGMIDISAVSPHDSRYTGPIIIGFTDGSLLVCESLSRWRIDPKSATALTDSELRWPGEK